jgi:hypothetical protein
VDTKALVVVDELNSSPPKIAKLQNKLAGDEIGRMGAPYGREQTAELATEAGRDVNQTLGRPGELPH